MRIPSIDTARYDLNTGCPRAEAQDSPFLGHDEKQQGNIGKEREAGRGFFHQRLHQKSGLSGALLELIPPGTMIVDMGSGLVQRYEATHLEDRNLKVMAVDHTEAILTSELEEVSHAVRLNMNLIPACLEDGPEGLEAFCDQVESEQLAAELGRLIEVLKNNEVGAVILSHSLLYIDNRFTKRILKVCTQFLEDGGVLILMDRLPNVLKEEKEYGYNSSGFDEVAELATESDDLAVLDDFIIAPELVSERIDKAITPNRLESMVSYRGDFNTAILPISFDNGDRAYVKPEGGAAYVLSRGDRVMVLGKGVSEQGKLEGMMKQFQAERPVIEFEEEVSDLSSWTITEVPRQQLADAFGTAENPEKHIRDSLARVQEFLQRNGVEIESEPELFIREGKNPPDASYCYPNFRDLIRVPIYRQFRIEEMVYGHYFGIELDDAAKEEYIGVFMAEYDKAVRQGHFDREEGIIVYEGGIPEINAYSLDTEMVKSYWRMLEDQRGVFYSESLIQEAISGYVENYYRWGDRGQICGYKLQEGRQLSEYELLYWYGASLVEEVLEEYPNKLEALLDPEVRKKIEQRFDEEVLPRINEIESRAVVCSEYSYRDGMKQERISLDQFAEFREKGDLDSLLRGLEELGFPKLVECIKKHDTSKFLEFYRAMLS